MNTWRQLTSPHWRPFTVLAACILLRAALDAGQGAFLSAASAYSTLQIFATVSLVTLGLGLTMMIREFDLSVVGMYGMAGNNDRSVPEALTVIGSSGLVVLRAEAGLFVG